MPKLLLIEESKQTGGDSLKQCLFLTREYSVDLANGSAEGLERVCFTRYDLIILNLNLPKSEAAELCKKLMQLSSSNILVVSTRADIDDKEASLDAGASDYLISPIHPVEFFARVRALLRRPYPVLQNCPQFAVR